MGGLSAPTTFFISNNRNLCIAVMVAVYSMFFNLLWEMGGISR
jgi:hypothetical protein